MHFIQPNTKLEKTYFFNSSGFRFLWTNFHDCLMDMSCCQVSGSLSVLYLWVAISYSLVHLCLFFFYPTSIVYLISTYCSFLLPSKMQFISPFLCLRSSYSLTHLVVVSLHSTSAVSTIWMSCSALLPSARLFIHPYPWLATSYSHFSSVSLHPVF